jgi:hypothetical protein
MDLALDELRENDERIDVEGLLFVLSDIVAGTIRIYGDLFIDYLDRPFFGKGFKLSVSGATAC